MEIDQYKNPPTLAPLVCDLDGTLMYRSDTDRIVELERRDNSLGPTALIELEGKNYLCFVADGPYTTYLNVDTWMLLRELGKHRPIICATGSPQTTIKRRLHLLDFAHSITYETGARILTKSGDVFVADPQWQEQFHPSKQQRQTLMTTLERDGWVVDAKGREFTLRLRCSANPALATFPLSLIPSGFTHSFNLGHLDIFPVGAGKLNAISYLLANIGATAMTYVGDDVNDLESFEKATEPILMGHAEKELQRVALKRGWTISPGTRIEGINKVLRTLLETAVDENPMVKSTPLYVKNSTSIADHSD